MTMDTKPFSVLLFGSHPDLDNDDCWTGEEFATLEEAQACLANPWATFNEAYHSSCTAFFVLDGVGLPDLVVRKNPDFRPRRADDEWKREAAMQAGMAFGCQGYNDEMGY
jgi:hypothetical protein